MANRDAYMTAYTEASDFYAKAKQDNQTPTALSPRASRSPVVQNFTQQPYYPYGSGIVDSSYYATPNYYDYALSYPIYPDYYPAYNTRIVMTASTRASSIGGCYYGGFHFHGRDGDGRFHHFGDFDHHVGRDFRGGDFRGRDFRSSGFHGSVSDGGIRGGGHFSPAISGSAGFGSGGHFGGGGGSRFGGGGHFSGGGGHGGGGGEVTSGAEVNTAAGVIAKCRGFRCLAYARHAKDLQCSMVPGCSE